MLVLSLLGILISWLFRKREKPSADAGA